MKIEQNVTLECSARGFPLKVEWKVMKGENEKVTPCVGKLNYTSKIKLFS